MEKSTRIFTIIKYQKKVLNLLVEQLSTRKDYHTALDEESLKSDMQWLRQR